MRYLLSRVLHGALYRVYRVPYMPYYEAEVPLRTSRQLRQPAERKKYKKFSPMAWSNRE